MKNLLIAILALFILSACSSSKRPEGFMPELEFSTPKDFDKYPEVTAFFNENVQSLNMQTLLLEEKAALCKPLIEKDEASLTESERAELGHLMMNFVDEYGKYMMLMSELELLSSSMAESVDPEHKEKVEKSVKILIDYAKQVKEKYQDFGISKEDIETLE